MAGVGGAGVKPGWASPKTWSAGGPALLFTPTTCALWLKASSIDGVANGAKVAQWNDQSGNGNNFVQATAANQPQYVEGASNLNGRPLLRFASNLNWMTIASMTIAAPCSVYAVIVPAIIVNLPIIFSSQGASVIPNCGLRDTGAVRLQNGGTLDSAAGLVVLTVPQILGWEVTGSGGIGNLYQNSTALLSSGSITGNTGCSGQATIGATNNGAAQQFNGDLYELIITTRVSTQTDRNAIFGYFSEEYGIPCVGI